MNHHPEYSSSPDSGNSADGASYLRQLKSNSSPTPSPVPTPQPAIPQSSTARNLGFKERRGCPRYHCSGSAEFRAQGGPDRLWGTLTDISQQGCYIEMNTTFPVDTKVDLVLKSCGIQITATGTVRASYPALGMGIRFSPNSPDAESQLKRLLLHLSDLAAPSLSVSTTEDAELEDAATRHALASADPAAFLHEIKVFFRNNGLLSRNEFHRIAKKVRRA